MLATQIESTYQAWQIANRKLLKAYENSRFDTFREAPKEKVEEKPPSMRPLSPEKPPKKQSNRSCARLNLWPLVADGKKEHPLLYETAASLLRSLYAKPLFGAEKRWETSLLDAVLQAAEQQHKDPKISSILLEKLSLPVPKASIFYRMLRGTRKNIDNPYPSLLDYFVCEEADAKICLPHASLELLTALFGEKTANELYREFQKEKALQNVERFKQLCIGEEELFSFQACPGSRHKTLVVESGDVCLRKEITLPRGGSS